MSAKIHVVPMYEDVHGQFGPGTAIINTCNYAGGWEEDFNPSRLGPIPLYGKYVSKNMTNAWSFSKLYKIHANPDNTPSVDYYRWAEAGWGAEIPSSFPLSRDIKPIAAVGYDGKCMGYIAARKRIFAPLYAEAVAKTDGYRRLKEIYEGEKTLVLRDYDGYDHRKLGMSLTQVLDCPSRKLGHSFVLAMMLTGDWALAQLTMRSTLK